MRTHGKTRKTMVSVWSLLVSTAAGVVVAGAAACALFGHRIGVPSLMGNLPGTGLAALLPLLIPVLAALALVGCAHFER
jgi:hypothetical protein